MYIYTDTHVHVKEKKSEKLKNIKTIIKNPCLVS